jgi:ABC-type cobalamin/Fe3+-siderophores transport system ATPase subunit
MFPECSLYTDLGPVWERNVGDLSGGELQRFAIGVVCVQEGDIYMFDEPSSYLDVKQRLNAAQVIHLLQFHAFSKHTHTHTHVHNTHTYTTHPHTHVRTHTRAHNAMVPFLHLASSQ